MKVVQLTEWQNKETREALERLHEMARRGELVGIAICYRTKDGKEMVLCTGPFRRQGVSSRAGFLMQMRDMAMPDTMFG